MSAVIKVDIVNNLPKVWDRFPKEALYIVGRVMREHTVKASGEINRKNNRLQDVIIKRNRRKQTRWKKDGTRGDNLSSAMISSHYKKNPNYWGVRFEDNRAMYLANRLNLLPVRDYRNFLLINDPTKRLAEELERKYAELAG